MESILFFSIALLSPCRDYIYAHVCGLLCVIYVLSMLLAGIVCDYNNNFVR